MIRDLTDAMQDYLKEIHKLRDGRRPRDDLGDRGTARRRPPSVTAMLKRLTALGPGRHTPYRGVELTPAGERVALEVIRHHRLLEQYLTQALGLSLDEVHSEADRSSTRSRRSSKRGSTVSLGFPTHDPHGDPIPDVNLRIDRAELRTLASLEPGDEATIKRVPDA